jgi:hypothetical protein
MNVDRALTALALRSTHDMSTLRAAYRSTPSALADWQRLSLIQQAVAADLPPDTLGSALRQFMLDPDRDHEAAMDASTGERCHDACVDLFLQTVRAFRIDRLVATIAARLSA